MVEEGGGEANSRRAGGDPVVGVLMLDTRFPRFAGDIGDAASMPWPTRYRIVPRASVARVVAPGALPEALLARFVAAGHELVVAGADVVVTSCGFLHPAQAALSRALTVPVITSALTLLPSVHARHAAAGPIGVMTFDARALDATRLGAGASLGPLVVGMEGTARFHPLIAGDLARADRAALERDAILVARRLARARPAAVVLECTNLSPYRDAIGRALGGVPIYDLFDAIRASAPFAAPLASPRFSSPRSR